MVSTPNERVKRKRKHAVHAESKHTPDTDRETDNPLAPLSWAERLKRVFLIDIEQCPRCGGRLRVITAITQPEVISNILDHIHQPQAPRLRPHGQIADTNKRLTKPG